MTRRILGVVADSSRAQTLARVLDEHGFAVATCLGAAQLDRVLLAFAPDTIVIDLDRLTWAAERSRLESVLRGRDVLVVLRDRGSGVAAHARRLSPRGIIVGVPTWETMAPWLQTLPPANPNRATFVELTGVAEE